MASSLLLSLSVIIPTSGTAIAISFVVAIYLAALSATALALLKRHKTLQQLQQQREKEENVKHLAAGDSEFCAFPATNATEYHVSGMRQHYKLDSGRSARQQLSRFRALSSLVQSCEESDDDDDSSSSRSGSNSENVNSDEKRHYAVSVRTTRHGKVNSGRLHPSHRRGQLTNPPSISSARQAAGGGTRTSLPVACTLLLERPNTSAVNNLAQNRLTDSFFSPLSFSKKNGKRNSSHNGSEHQNDSSPQPCSPIVALLTQSTPTTPAATKESSMKRRDGSRPLCALHRHCFNARENGDGSHESSSEGTATSTKVATCKCNVKQDAHHHTREWILSTADDDDVDGDADISGDDNDENVFSGEARVSIVDMGLAYEADNEAEADTTARGMTTAELNLGGRLDGSPDDKTSEVHTAKRVDSGRSDVSFYRCDGPIRLHDEDEGGIATHRSRDGNLCATVFAYVEDRADAAVALADPPSSSSPLPRRNTECFDAALRLTSPRRLPVGLPHFPETITTNVHTTTADFAECDGERNAASGSHDTMPHTRAHSPRSATAAALLVPQVAEEIQAYGHASDTTCAMRDLLSAPATTPVEMISSISRDHSLTRTPPTAALSMITHAEPSTTFRSQDADACADLPRRANVKRAGARVEPVFAQKVSSTAAAAAVELQLSSPSHDSFVVPERSSMNHEEDEVVHDENDGGADDDVDRMRGVVSTAHVVHSFRRGRCESANNMDSSDIALSLPLLSPSEELLCEGCDTCITTPSMALPEDMKILFTH